MAQRSKDTSPRRRSNRSGIGSRRISKATGTKTICSMSLERSLLKALRDQAAKDKVALSTHVASLLAKPPGQSRIRWVRLRLEKVVDTMYEVLRQLEDSPE